MTRNTPCDQVDRDLEDISQLVKETERLYTKLFELEDNGIKLDWEQLRGRPGVCLEPMSWDEVSKVINDGSIRSLATLGRTPQGTRAYRQFCRDYILSKYETVTDYLFATVFGLGGDDRGGDNLPDPHQTAAKGTKVKISVPFDFSTKRELVWRLNDFPYALEQGIEHHILWCSTPLSDMEMQAAIEEHRPSAVFESLYFVNPTALKSIPAIWHAHVLSRRR